ncbi:GGDEF domain-containing protein [Pseudosporangium ferrugineum]|uniref:Diguanylate cyclase (GGDEF)-like protein n=1 Tax=Pseudosporangium ferrugineum TaxID=439699 RepID=A0A2T0S3C7_9ACTN|nr:GGDEF domain-containing protein [Pseudosporangium ferrugineum]PRY27928.1 diguanylate cyclase (GGDEF)-like protein [Pseudosporangium ferrugineum]
MSSSILRKVALACAVLLGFGLVAGAGFYLAHTQAGSRASVLQAFDERARLAAGLTGDTLLASDPKTRELATAAFASDGDALTEALVSTLDASLPWMAVIKPDGTPLGASSDSALSRVAKLGGDGALDRALRTGMIAFSDLVTEDGVSWVYAFQPYSVGGGTRILVMPQRATDINILLHSVVSVAGAKTYVVDSTGHVIVAADATAIGAKLPDTALAAAASKPGRGVVNHNQFVAGDVSGSDWLAIVVTPRAALLAPYDRTARSAWLIFAAFAAAVVLMMVIGAGMLTSSARVAHARLHDQLTGLPTRALFLQSTEAAIGQWRREYATSGPASGPVAALFLDLDGFKPVNDTYGHAAGDALLKAVAERLVAATRPEDFVSRFGGDEFLVLCRGLQTEDDAFAVADRIQNYLNEPFEVLGQTVRIGVSIGIATVGEYADQAESLIHNADTALYQAKNNGRGRIERFTPDMAPA